MKYNKNEYLIIRIGLSPLCTETSTMEIVKVIEVDENEQKYNILFGDGTNLSIEERSLIGNSYKLDINPLFFERLADRTESKAGQKKDEHYLVLDLYLKDGNPVHIHIYVEGSSIYYYPYGFDANDSRIRIDTFEEFQIAVRERQNIEMLFEIDTLANAYGRIEDPLKELLGNLFDRSTEYEQIKNRMSANMDASKEKELSDKVEEAKERFLSVCRAIDHAYKGTPDKSPFLQALYQNMISIHQAHFGNGVNLQ